MYYSVEQVAELFQCSQKTVLELVRSGQLRGARFGKSYTFSSEDLARCYRVRAETTREAATLPALP